MPYFKEKSYQLSVNFLSFFIQRAVDGALNGRLSRIFLALELGLCYDFLNRYGIIGKQRRNHEEDNKLYN